MRPDEEERAASSLDIPDEEARLLAERAVELALDWLRPGDEVPVFEDTSADEVAALFRRPLPPEGSGLDSLERELRQIARYSRHNNHRRMFGYIASPATHPGAFAGLLASALNSNVASWRSAPAATEVERTVVRWLAEIIGYAGKEDEAAGVLTSGGSMANLLALFVAHRTAAGPDASRRGLWSAGPPATLYTSEQVHLSIPKAAGVLGLGTDQVRAVPLDERFRIDVRALAERIEADRREGLRPFCVVANAGTVSTGAVDPLAEVARVAREHGLWLHVDGAYGALAAADESKRPLFAGLEEADSVSLDPHKWLYTPVDCGCLLLRRPALARAAFGGAEAPEYIKVFEKQPDETFAFWDYGLELSRPFRALKVWTTLRYFGARRVAAAISEDNRLAAYLGERVAASGDFELLAPVTLGICCFRYVPPGLRAALERAAGEERERLEARVDALNAGAMQRVQRGGKAYLSNAVLRGRFALRASITNFRTTRADLDGTLEAVRQAASQNPSVS